jgi:hypothetical protein
MIKYIKSQWSRFKQAWRAFRREWLFNGVDRSDPLVSTRPFWIMGLGRLKDPNSYPDSSFDMLPPYYGQALTRFDGHVFTLKHTHYNPKTLEVRYFDTDKPKDGFIVLTETWLRQDPQTPDPFR